MKRKVKRQKKITFSDLRKGIKIKGNKGYIYRKLMKLRSLLRKGSIYKNDGKFMCAKKDLYIQLKQKFYDDNDEVLIEAYRFLHIDKGWFLKPEGHYDYVIHAFKLEKRNPLVWVEIAYAKHHDYKRKRK